MVSLNLSGIILGDCVLIKFVCTLKCEETWLFPTVGSWKLQELFLFAHVSAVNWIVAPNAFKEHRPSVKSTIPLHILHVLLTALSGIPVTQMLDYSLPVSCYYFKEFCFSCLFCNSDGAFPEDLSLQLLVPSSSMFSFLLGSPLSSLISDIMLFSWRILTSHFYKFHFLAGVLHLPLLSPVLLSLVVIAALRYLSPPFLGGPLLSVCRLNS